MGKILFLTLFNLPYLLLVGQAMNISEVTVVEGDSGVDVPVLISFPDSSLGFQLSIVWPENELKLDTVIFSEELVNQNIVARYNSPSNGELRVIVQPVFVGALNTIEPLKDLLGFTIRFQLTSHYVGPATIEFNPDFSNLFIDGAGHVYPSLTNGSVSNEDGTVSTSNFTSSNTLKIYPNPTKEGGTVSGLPAERTNANFRIVDVLGRVLLTGKFHNGGFRLTQSIPPGTYWVLIDGGGGKTFIEPFVKSQ